MEFFNYEIIIPLKIFIRGLSNGIQDIRLKNPDTLELTISQTLEEEHFISYRRQFQHEHQYSKVNLQIHNQPIITSLLTYT